MGVVLADYAGSILTGSVHLAWHYGVDGYVSIVLTWLLSRAAGWLVVRDPGLDPALGPV